MTEPKTRANRIERLCPWLLHWSIRDERIGGFRSDAYAVDTRVGLVVIDALPLEEPLEAEIRTGLKQGGILFLTHGNHQRSAWRLRQETGASVYAPAGANIDFEPDVWVDEKTELPSGLRVIAATGFQAPACYLAYSHPGSGERAVFCGDLICQDPDGPYRFPVEPGYFDLVGGQADAKQLLEFDARSLCAAHAAPTVTGCRDALRSALTKVR